jgi:hypothetical protein
MKKFIVLLREPDGRTITHSDSATKAHQENWKNWLSTWGQKGKLSGGSGLTLNGRIIKDHGNAVTDEIYKDKDEIVGGYLLLNAEDFNEAVDIMKACPIYEFDGYAEIRELQNQD